MTKLGLLLIVAAGAACPSAACPSKEPPSDRDRAGSQAAGTGSAASPPGAPAGSAAGSATGSAGDEIASRNMTGLLQHHAANCPSSLPGTTTRLVMTTRGVDVSVTSMDSRIAHRIVALARFHASGRTAEVSRPHDQKHGGPGWIGYCPILVTDQTMVTMTPIDHGATLHVDARSPSQVTELQQAVKARAVRLPGYTSS
jgi:hypothetical protein